MLWSVAIIILGLDLADYLTGLVLLRQSPEGFINISTMVER